MLNDDKLKHLQKCELLIADEIKRICDKNDIRYFMVAGTMLGAIRHQGFIPWDDDMDFGMERAEYEKFCKICKTELSQAFKLQTWDTDNSYPFSFGKIRLNNTHIRELFASPHNSCDGIFVDIFPFDNAPDDSKLFKKQGFYYYLFKRALWLKKGYGINIKKQGLKQKVKYELISIALAIIPYRYLKYCFNRVIQKYNAIETKRLVFDAPYSYEKNCVEREWVLDLTSYPFENNSFPAFKSYNTYLAHLYGDYMELPEIRKRHSHDILSVEFGKYSSYGVQNT